MNNFFIQSSIILFLKLNSDKSIHLKKNQIKINYKDKTLELLPSF